MTLTEFLTNRYNEQEATAWAAIEITPGTVSKWTYEYQDFCGEDFWIIGTDTDESAIVSSGYEGGGAVQKEYAQHIAAHDPAATLADLAVKREILDLYTVAGGMSRDSERFNEWQFTFVILNKIVLMEAARYADHPDYNPGWKRP